MADGPVLLSCEQCKRRKTKCDKTLPRCSACRAANISCHIVQRSRLPRGRTGNVKHKNLALADKVARLENLVGRLEAQIQENENITASVESGPATNTVRSTNRVEDLVAKDFWVALSKEVTGLRETLEGTDGDDSQQPDPAVHRYQPGAQNTPNLLLFNRDSESSKYADTYITPSMRTVLVQIYYDRIDILFKVTHWPTVMKMLQGDGRNDMASKSNVASTALGSCIYFTAATALSNQDCEELCLGPKTVLVENCRHYAENFLSQSNLLIEPSFTSVQAFTIYLMGLRNSGQGAMTWTLIALVIRLANALDLGSETNNTLSALDIEQRRRVWFAIGLLDSQAAFGRGSVPLLPHTDLKQPPLNINDAEVGIRTVSTHPSTEMSFSCLTHRALLCQRKLCDPFTSSFQDRAKIVSSFESAMRHEYAHLKNSDVPLERYTAVLANDVCVNMNLLLWRPPWKSVSSDPSHPTPDASQFDILATATSSLEYGLAKQHSPEFRKWSWFTWPRWYALAIVLVELCSCPIKPQTELEIRESDRDVDKAYSIALESFNNYAQSASEIASGTIWTPIIKLMRRVQQLRGVNVMSNQKNHVSLNIDTPAPAQPSNYIVLSRYCDAMADSKTDTAAVETNPDLLWDAFLEDLSETTVVNTSTSTSASIPFSTSRSPFETTAPKPSATSPTSGSTWSLMPYLPILPALDNRYNDSGQSRAHVSSQPGQSQGQTNNVETQATRKGYSVLGPIVL